MVEIEEEWVEGKRLRKGVTEGGCGLVHNMHRTSFLVSEGFTMLCFFFNFEERGLCTQKNLMLFFKIYN